MRFLALVVVIIGAFFFFLSVKPAEKCPNPTFVKKHMCRGQPTAENALKCSKQRNQNPQLSPTNKNTVFIGTSDFEQVGTDCINRVGLVAFSCTLGKTNEYCKHIGDNCKAPHNVGNGHLFYQKIQC